MTFLFIAGGVIAYIIMLVFTACWAHMPSDGKDCCEDQKDGDGPPLCVAAGCLWPVVLPCMIVYKVICKPLFEKKKLSEPVESLSPCSRPHYEVGDWKNEELEMVVTKTRKGKK